MLSNGFTAGRIVAARKPLKLKVAKGKKTISLEEGQIGQIVSTGVTTPGGAPQVYVLWQKKGSNLRAVLQNVAMVAGIYWSGGLGAAAITRLLGGWQSFGELKFVLAPADAVDLLIMR